LSDFAYNFGVFEVFYIGNEGFDEKMGFLRDFT
jgi:hypothetical protein